MSWYSPEYFFTGIAGELSYLEASLERIAGGRGITLDRGRAGQATRLYPDGVPLIAHGLRPWNGGISGPSIGIATWATRVGKQRATAGSWVGGGNAHEADTNGAGLWVVVVGRHVDVAAFGVGDVHLLGAVFPGNGGLGVLWRGRGNRCSDTNGDRGSTERSRKLRRKRKHRLGLQNKNDW